MDGPLRSLFNDIAEDWDVFVRSSGAQACLVRWSLEEPVLTPFERVEDLVSALRARGDFDRRDALWFAVLRLARHELDARRVALYALWPGLNAVAQRYGRRWDYDDTAAEVIATALERIAAYPMHRRSSPPANIVLDVRNRLHVRRERERALDVALGPTVNSDVAADEPAEPNGSSSVELLRLVRDSVDHGDVSRRGAKLILLHRILDVPTRQVASVDGRRDGTIRKARERAEAALASSVAVA
jgi:DNA-directed RNA polymerase specialized sigma24 family protein